MRKYRVGLRHEGHAGRRAGRLTCGPVVLHSLGRGTAEMSTRTRTRATAVLTLAVMLAVGAQPPAASAANDTIRGLKALGTPFIPDGDRFRETVGARLSLSRDARVTLTVRTTGGSLVRTLADGVRTDAGRRTWRWDGRDDAGSLVADGQYTITAAAANGLGTDSASIGVRKGLPRIFPANPAAITVVVNPGHGGADTGAYRAGGLYEKDFNLDISRKLRRLLRDAGVTVVMTRTSDVEVNSAGADVNGDGRVNQKDELLARVDIGNLARADLHINPHNNAAPCRCTRGTTTYTNFKRTWTPAGMDLAGLLHRHQLEQLGQHSSSSYTPIDLGVRHRNFMVNRPYELPLVPRPSLMPAILTESLFMSNDVELALLRRADVRFSIAVAFYLAVEDYIDSRDYGIRYRLVDGPSGAVGAGGTTDYRLQITNRGNRTSSGWRLEMRYVPAVARYDGSGAAGELLALRAIPDGLAPGESVEIPFNDMPVPAAAGQWLVKADVRLADGSYLAPRGVVALQTQLTTTR